MGEGLVLESGTHEGLLRSETGPYSLLVTAQKLREARQKELAHPDDPDQMDEVSLQGVSHSRRNTIQSSASDSIDRQQKAHGQEDYGLFRLLRRFSILNRDQWTRYVFAFIFASSIAIFFSEY